VRAVPRAALPSRVQPRSPVAEAAASRSTVVGTQPQPRPRSANASTLRVPIAGSRALPSRADTGTRLGPDLLPQPGGFEGFLRIKECLRPHDPAVPHVENGEGPPDDRHAAGLPE